MQGLAVLVLAALGALEAAEDPVVSRRFASELELATESFELVAIQDGQETEQRGPASVREQADEVEIEDTLHAQGPTPTHFTRLYQTATSAYRLGVGGEPRERLLSAGLEGKSVTFEREDDGTWARTTENDDVRRGQLKRLRAELFLSAFLPAEASETGTSWEIPCTHLMRLISPVEEGWRQRGQAPRDPSPGGALDVAPAALLEPIGRLMAELEGTLVATRIEAGADDELPFQATLEFELESLFDGSDSLLRGRAAEVEDEVRVVYRGTGTLAWDPDSGRIEITCNGALDLRERFEVRAEANGASGEVRGSLSASGTLELEASESQGE